MREAVGCAMAAVPHSGKANSRWGGSQGCSGAGGGARRGGAEVVI